MYKRLKVYFFKRNLLQPVNDGPVQSIGGAVRSISGEPMPSISNELVQSINNGRMQSIYEPMVSSHFQIQNQSIIQFTSQKVIWRSMESEWANGNCIRLKCFLFTLHKESFHVQWVPCHHGTARPQVADGGDGLQEWKVAASMSNKQLRATDKM
jgi:hypothetical protein